MCITRLHKFCIYEVCGRPTNADDSQGNETGFIISDINETCISGNCVLWDIIAHELAQRSLERPTFN